MIEVRAGQLCSLVLRGPHMPWKYKYTYMYIYIYVRKLRSNCREIRRFQQGATVTAMCALFFKTVTAPVFNLPLVVRPVLEAPVLGSVIIAWWASESAVPFPAVVMTTKERMKCCGRRAHPGTNQPWLRNMVFVCPSTRGRKWSAGMGWVMVK